VLKMLLVLGMIVMGRATMLNDEMRVDRIAESSDGYGEWETWWV
jgi:hypothetical protein